MAYNNGQTVTLNGPDGDQIRVRLEVNSKARRLILRLDERRREAVAIAPTRRQIKDAAAFAAERIDWISTRLQHLPEVVRFEENNLISYRGAPCRLTAQGQGRVARMMAGQPNILCAPGDPETLHLRVTRYLKKQARADITRAVNRHAAQVLVGQKLPYQTVTTVENTSMQNVEFLEVGTSLVFRPFISEDGYVRMEIHPKNSSGIINAQGLPEETTTEVTTNILVKSGNTVVIGGLMESGISSDISQVPLLGSIPFIGRLFRSEKEVETRNEVVVLLTPRIVGDDELGQRAGEAIERHAAAQARLAAGHSGYLRPSYARRMHADAAKALAAGRPDLALAKAEWGLAALPSHDALAALADHCRQEILDARLEAEELNEALSLLEKMEESQ